MDYDDLPDYIKKKFREFEIEYYHPLWIQCTFLTENLDDAFEMFKKYWVRQLKSDPYTLVLPKYML